MFISPESSHIVHGGSVAHVFCSSRRPACINRGSSDFYNSLSYMPSLTSCTPASLRQQSKCNCRLLAREHCELKRLSKIVFPFLRPIKRRARVNVIVRPTNASDGIVGEEAEGSSRKESTPHQGAEILCRQGEQDGR